MVTLLCCGEKYSPPLTVCKMHAIKQVEVLCVEPALLWSRTIVLTKRHGEMYREVSWKWQIFNWCWLVSILPCNGGAECITMRHSAWEMCSPAFGLQEKLSVGWMAESPLLKLKSIP